MKMAAGQAITARATQSTTKQRSLSRWDKASQWFNIFVRFQGIQKQRMALNLHRIVMSAKDASMLFS